MEKNKNFTKIIKYTKKRDSYSMWNWTEKIYLATIKFKLEMKEEYKDLLKIFWVPNKI